MLRLTSWILIFLCTTMVSAGEGDISPAMLEQFDQHIKDSDITAIQNAVSNNDVRKLALNRKKVGHVNDLFAVQIDVPEITNQKSSGRCWLFTSLNVLRPKVIERFNLEHFEFSENYCFFWDQLEKSNLFLEAIISTRDLDLQSRRMEWLFRHPIGDGGVWNDAVAVIEKYGVVPKSVMPESHNSENTRLMNAVLRRKLREDALVLRRMHKEGKTKSELEHTKTLMLQDIYQLLVIHLGTPPKEFTWRYKDTDGNLIEPKTYTPIEFYQKTVGVNLDDYVMMMNDPTRDYYQVFEVEYDRNIWSAVNWTYVNLPTEDLKEMAKKSIVGKEPMYFSCDVGKQLNRDSGVLCVENYDYESLYGVSFSMSKKQRIQSFDSGSSHGMSLIGVDTTATGKTTKWLLENSWGKDRGHNGFLIMTDRWFDEYMFRLVVKKDFVPLKILAIYKQKPIKLEPWDPMYWPIEDD